MKKTFISLLFGLLLLGVTSRANAATYTVSPPSADVFVYAVGVADLSYLTVNHEANTIVNFDISGINSGLAQNEQITSGSLQMFLYEGTYWQSNPVTKAYLFGHNWSEAGITYAGADDFDINQPLATGILAQDGLSKSWTFDFSAPITTNYLSLAIVMDQDSGQEVFYSREFPSDLAPRLTINTINSTGTGYGNPVPEPSSMILGLMSLAGAMGLRKKNKA